MVYKKEIVIISGGRHSGVVKLNGAAEGGVLRGSCSLGFVPSDGKLYLIGAKIAEIALNNAKTEFEVRDFANNGLACYVQADGKTLFGAGNSSMRQTDVTARIEKFLKEKSYVSSANDASGNTASAEGFYAEKDNKQSRQKDNFVSGNSCADRVCREGGGTAGDDEKVRKYGTGKSSASENHDESCENSVDNIHHKVMLKNAKKHEKTAETAVEKTGKMSVNTQNASDMPVKNDENSRFEGVETKLSTSDKACVNGKKAEKGQSEPIGENGTEFADDGFTDGRTGNDRIADERFKGQVSDARLAEEESLSGFAFGEGVRYDGTNFYAAVKPQIDEMFICYPEERELEEVVPNSKWVRIDADGDVYVIGVLYDGEIPSYLCYGIPGEYAVKPPREYEKLCVWLPLSEDRGYWVIYQSAVNGKIVK